MLRRRTRPDHSQYTPDHLHQGTLNHLKQTPTVISSKHRRLDTLCARNTPRPDFRGILPVWPRPTSPLLEDCIAAAGCVKTGAVTATSEEDREMVAARTLQHVATAASTSRSYPAFVAAATFAEMMSLIQAETPLRSVHLQVEDREDFQRRRRHAFDTAIKAAMDVIAATDGMTSNSNEASTNT